MSAQVIVNHPTQAPHGLPPAVDALQAHFRSLKDLVEDLESDTYRATPSCTSGSIGEHVRHCLDHAHALLSAASRGELTYDSRLRGTAVETDPSAAADGIDRLCLDLEDVDERALQRPLRLRVVTHLDGPATKVATTVGREVTFVVQHTIHHCAMIAVLLERLGIAVPDRFGYAPSTPSRG
jgi:uncharacterized damage-inducible protein DinB